MNSLSGTEIVIILVILIIVFGSKRIIDFARGAGETTKELKKIKKEYESTVKEVTDMDPKGGDSHT